jgi:hypothetical protein
MIHYRHVIVPQYGQPRAIRRGGFWMAYPYSSSNSHPHMKMVVLGLEPSHTCDLDFHLGKPR